MIINALLFNALWLGLVVIGNAFIPLAIIGLCFHLCIVNNTLHEAKVMAAVAGIGLLADVLLTFAGVFEFTATPYWLLFLWLAFASTINHSLKWVARLPYAAHISGLLFAPLSYLAAERLGAVSFGLSTLSTYLLLGVVWLLLLNVFVLISTARRFNYAKSLQ
ncbi:DUF2878 domain-containing protein [Reinekea marinisedimentorum]|uniref:Uncharacterized protein DUF2878 n=1 Tax=Reinekea marinisedimentorum TaxID=230495 RepID=A0A4R3HVK8_9GAMM|nr:DUF2878 domain-containing protein [Reinekea marinisedimentorum]TCS37128.1 uncharacterized protein DUF2878 [Reinekea marinisedimentorum]